MEKESKTTENPGNNHFTTDEKSMPVYYSKLFIIIVFCCFGPVALPFIWLRPNTSLLWKLGLTVMISVFSILLYFAFLASLHSIRELYELLQ